MPRPSIARSRDRVIPYSPGVDARTVHFGVLLPPRDALPSAAEAVRLVVEAHAASVNRSGGIHGRSLEPSFDDTPGFAQERAGAARAFLDRERLFALGASYVDGAEPELAALAEELRVPLIATAGSPSATTSAWTRALLAGPAEVARALVVFAARHLGAKRRVAVAHDGKAGAARDAALNEARRAAFALTEDADLRQAERAFETLLARRCDTLVFLASAALLEQLGTWARAHEWQPLLLVPASAVPPESVNATGLEGWLALPTGPFDRTARGLGDYRELQFIAQLKPEYPTLQFTALAACELFAEALRRSGRELTRERLLDHIDALREFRTGLVPPLSFSATRHVGSTGAWIVPLNAATEMVWVEGE